MPVAAILLMALQAHAMADPTEVLARSRDRFLASVHRLPDYTCLETVEQRYFDPRRFRKPLPSCAESIASRAENPPRLILRASDRLRLDVKVSEGVEIGSWPGAASFETGSIFGLTGGGPFYTGPLGTMLWDLFTSVSRFQYVAREPHGDRALLRYTFEVSAERSHSYINAGDSWIAVAYRGSIWIDPVSEDPQRVEVESSDLPEGSHGCQTITTADYRRVPIGTGEFLVPLDSALHMLMTDESETEALTSWSACHQFVGEAKLLSDDELPPPGRGVAPHMTPIALPPGLTVVLDFAAPLDTATAAAGDAIVLRVRKPVHDQQTKAVLVPAGAAVRCRIVRMRHMLASPRSFDIAILFQALETGGVYSPFYAQPSAKGNDPGSLDYGPRIDALLPPFARGMSAASFSFETRRARYVVPQGYESLWVTTAPPVRSTADNPKDNAQ